MPTAPMHVIMIEMLVMVAVIMAMLTIQIIMAMMKVNGLSTLMMLPKSHIMSIPSLERHDMNFKNVLYIILYER